ncbi:hypothetical protein HPB47_001599 [Ixodes persulcatus]|uniref:Uncharacterized protein n=1 Tax=Ixodes persulcatus TaxID=34615 RepID=A0AC60PNJ9_IXOPE|nr:hypothetical protein HPB47_001599 [Ixodes persulcatus]
MLRLGVYADKHHQSFAPSNIIHHVEMRLGELALEVLDGCGGPRSPPRPSPLASASPKKASSSLLASCAAGLAAGGKGHHHRGEEGWKEVVRRSKKVTVPSSAISRVIGRCGCNINAIREASGAHIEVEKHKGQGERTILIRGSAEATKQAQLLITGLVQEPDRDLSDIMAQHGVTVGPKAPPEVPQQQQQAPPTGGRAAASGAAVAAAPCLPASAPSASQLASSVLVSGGGGKPGRQASSAKVASAKAAAPAPSLPPFGQTRPAPRPGIPTLSGGAQTSSSGGPPFALGTSGWGSAAPAKPLPGAAPASSATAPTTATTQATSAAVNGTAAAAASYTQAVISPAKRAEGRAASADPRQSSSPSSGGSPSPTLSAPAPAQGGASPGAPSGAPLGLAQTFSPFNNVFSKETQPSVWGQREASKPNFASVAASGVCGPPGGPQAPGPDQPVVDAAKAPGYRGNLHVTPPNYGPIGSGPRSAPCTPPIGAPASPPQQHQQQQQEYYEGSQHAAVSPSSRMVFAPSPHYGLGPPEMGGPPQAAPSAIQSTLNPNAPDFSSRSAAPPVMMAPPPHHLGSHQALRAPPFAPQDFLQQQGLGAHQGHPAVFPLQMMSHLQQQYSGLVAPVGQLPKGDRTPLGIRLTDDGSPSSLSPQQGGLSPTVGSSHPGDDRKLPRPIGTERAQKKNVPLGAPSYPPPNAATGIWSYPNTSIFRLLCDGVEDLSAFTWAFAIFFRVAFTACAGSAVSSELSPMAAWVQYQHAAGAQGDGLPQLLHNRFAEGPSENALEHSYHQQQQQLGSGLGGCPPFLNGFPTVANHLLGGGAQLFPPAARVAAEAPHQEAPWSPHKLMADPMAHHHHHHHPGRVQPHHPQQPQHHQPQHHPHVAAKLGKLVETAHLETIGKRFSHSLGDKMSDCICRCSGLDVHLHDPPFSAEVVPRVGGLSWVE